MGCNFFNRPLGFGFCYCLLVAIQVAFGTYIASTLTTLEKQYRVKSSVSALILSTSDFTSLVSIVLVTYIGQKWHRPRIIGICALFIALGAMLSGMPHFFYPAYREGDNTVQTANGTASIFTCDTDRKPQICSKDDIDDSGSRIDEAWALFVGQALMGLSYGPLMPIAFSYIDDAVRGTTTPYYIAAVLSSGTTAALIGFGQGFAFLQVNVNWPAPPDYTKEWIGAWWLGFIVDGIIIMLIAIPFFFFPKEMTVQVDEEDIPEERKAQEAKKDQATQIGVRDFLSAMKRLVLNLVYMMLMLSSIFELAAAASTGYFMPKFLEIQYDIPASFASLLLGFILMPAALIGNVSSGIIVKRLNLTSRGLGRFVVTLTVLIMCCIPVIYVLKCPETNYAGYNDGVLRITQDCNENCTCTTERFAPVCGANGQVYATPCLAGCTGERQDRTDDPNVSITVYTGCTCVAGDQNVTGVAGEALKGKCAGPCNMVYYAGILIFCLVLFVSIVQNPLVIMQMRATGHDKTVALGITMLFSRAIGFLPSPIYFGALFDVTCVLDRIECGVPGDCLMYDAQRFGLTFLAVFFGLKSVNLLFYSIATLKMTRTENSADEETEAEKTVKNDVTMDEIEEGADNKGFIDGIEIGIQTELTSF